MCTRKLVSEVINSAVHEFKRAKTG
jgi:hypothetical protein